MQRKNKKKDKETDSFWDFLEFTGKTGRKDVKFLSVGYIFCLLLLFVARKSIPIELFYVTLGLPFAFFGFAFIFWCIKRSFLSVYRRVSFGVCVTISAVCFLIWSALITLFFMYGKNLSETKDNDFYVMFPVIFLLAICGFLSFQILWNGFAKVKKSKRHLLIYTLGHIALAVTLYFMVEYNDKSIYKSDSFTNLYIGAVVLQISLYSVFSLILFFKVLQGKLFTLLLENLPRK